MTKQYIPREECAQLKQALASKNLTQQDFAVQIGYTSCYTNRVLNGRLPVSKKFRDRLEAVLRDACQTKYFPPNVTRDGLPAFLPQVKHFLRTGQALEPADESGLTREEKAGLSLYRLLCAQYVILDEVRQRVSDLSKGRLNDGMTIDNLIDELGTLQSLTRGTFIPLDTKLGVLTGKKGERARKLYSQAMREMGYPISL